MRRRRRRGRYIKKCFIVYKRIKTIEECVWRAGERVGSFICSVCTLVWFAKQPLLLLLLLMLSRRILLLINVVLNFTIFHFTFLFDLILFGFISFCRFTQYYIFLSVAVEAFCVCVCVLSWTSALSFRPTTEFSLQSWFHPFFSSMQIDLFSAVICHFTFEWAMSSFLLCNKKFVESFASDNFSIDKSDRSFCFRLHNVFGFCVRLLPSKYESLVYIVIVYQSLISIWPHFTSFSMF